MWSSKKTKTKPKSGAADTLITRDTKINGDISFSGVLFVDGHVKGNISAKDGSHSLLTIGAQGHVEGEVKVPQVVIYGYVKGDVYASEHIHLQKDAQVEGNVYYNLLEMAMGSAVNGQLVKSDNARKLLDHKPKTNEQEPVQSAESSDHQAN